MWGWGTTASFGALLLQLEGTQAAQMRENLALSVGSQTEPREACRPIISVFLPTNMVGWGQGLCDLSGWR